MQVAERFVAAARQKHGDERMETAMAMHWLACATPWWTREWLARRLAEEWSPHYSAASTWSGLSAAHRSPKTVKEYRSVIVCFARFLGHDDVRRVSPSSE